MSIDWFTFAAQMVNFLILVVLLRWFLYGPIVRAMERREEKIAMRLQQADQSRREGDERVREYQQKMHQLEEQREAALRDVRGEVDVQRQRLTTQARAEVQSKRLEWFQAFERERAELLSELQRRVGQLSAETARRTLVQLADEALEERMLATFTARLQQLKDERREEIEGVLRNGRGEVFVRSAFHVSDKWRDRLRATVRKEFGYEGSLDFEESPELICGIELAAGGYGFGWNVNEFLRNLEAEFDERLKTNVRSARK